MNFRSASGIIGAGAWLLVVALVSGGCAGRDDTAAAGAAIRVEREQVSGAGFTYVVSRDDARVTLAVARHGLRERARAGDPEIDSPYAADVVLRNRHDFPFVTSGEHGLLEPDEYAPARMAGRELVQDEQLDDLQLAVDAVEVVADRPEVHDAFRWELRRLRSLAEFALQNANNVIDGTAVPASTPSLRTAPGLLGLVEPTLADADPVPGTAQASTYIHQVTIRRGPCFFCGDSGEHSAVVLNIYYASGTYIGSVSTQNHGREATDPSMTTAFNCPKTYSGRTTAFPNFQPYVNTDLIAGIYGDAGGCDSGYGVTAGRHVCNDDSQAQYNNIKYNIAGTWSFCRDSSLAFWAPYCN